MFGTKRRAIEGGIQDHWETLERSLRGRNQMEQVGIE